MNQQSQTKISNSQYDTLIEDSLKNSSAKEKSITIGKVISIENEVVTIDVGLKSEGRIPLSEFSRPGQKTEVEVGDETEVFIENVDNANGETLLSREKAVRQKAWHNLQNSFNENKVVTGVPFNRVKGGMSVDLDGVVAFLPGSQIETRQIIKDTKELLNKPLELMILKMDKYRGNIVVSRKAITENELKEQRSELLKNIKEGSIIEGKVKNITDYGAFIDLGGIDGLVHVTDISWTKINNPSDVLELNTTIKIKVLKFDEELSRLSLGIKQLTENPWDKVSENIQNNERVLAKVVSMNDNNVHLIINNNYDGVIPLSEISWLKKPPHPSKIVNINDELEVLVLDIDEDKTLAALEMADAPEWMSVDLSSGMLSGLPLANDVGSLLFELKGAYSDGTEFSQSISLTVKEINDAPTIDNSLPTSVAEDAEFAHQFEFSDEEDGSENLSFEIKSICKLKGQKQPTAPVERIIIE